MTDIPEASAQKPAFGTPAEVRPELRNWCEAWKSCFQNVLTQVAGQPHIFEISSQPLSAAESDVWYTVVAGGAAHGEMTLRLPAASGTRLAQKFLGEIEPAAIGGTTETVPVENITAENKEALEELLRQIAGLAATALAVTAGGEVQLHLSASTAPAWSSDAIFSLRTTNAAAAGTPAVPETISLEIRISPALAATLLPRVQPEPPAQRSTSTSPAPASSYRRLMDVGLEVKLRFGTRRMLLRDILALSAGVVVELDNHLHSPVDLLLDERLIAQGEVVVVDGKYGLRITDVVDPGTAAGAAG
jgi:flagellar motor switch protein FliN/FliY